MVEGLADIVDDFYYILRGELKRRRSVSTLYELKIVAEDIIMELSERYRERVGQKSSSWSTARGPRKYNIWKSQTILHSRRRL